MKIPRSYLRAAALGLWISLLLGVTTVVSSQTKPRPDPNFEALRSRYLRLRNTDSQVEKLEEWIKVGSDLESYADHNVRSAFAAQALFDAALLHENLFRKMGGRDRAKRALALFERVARNYPGNLLADDALVRKGDLLLFELSEVERAKRSYAEVLEAYASSDMYPVARARMSDIQKGTLPSTGSSTPSDSSLDPVQRATGPLVVIDPGHGGEDFGAVGLGGLLEKDVTLAVAFELERLLQERLNAVVRLTRRRDEFVPLMDRTAMANDFAAELFLSLHSNASPNGKARGFEVYYLDNTNDKSSKTLAERENASLQIGGTQGDLQFMLSDLIQNAKLEDSIMLANLISSGMKNRLGKSYPSYRHLGVKKAPFYVLVGAHMPCVLVEMFFIDNKLDGSRLSDRAFRGAIAEGMYDGVKEFLDRSQKYG